MTARLDFVIEKGAKFHQKIDITADNGLPRDMTGKTIACIIKESIATDTILHNLTEANSGVEILDRSQGKISLNIYADETAEVDVIVGFYTIIEYDNLFPEEEINRLLEGKVFYSGGTN